ncbi:MAG: NUDIX hydrolase [Candidatus Moranbacteria bacterium GW2011_GWE1_49_15]|nr:MAG: NUDIX hydrolase [Candidatus Moranbacteria bacterium GW2011_GWE2_47_10]KKW07103.1 MAG: NUDIX hydrolase [Candidatus Moranbacteria bacterium GW2011_GWE1_49_15]HBP01112.1 hypothetical protein [Candidatus Moranbacteria bacterium]
MAEEYFDIVDENNDPTGETALRSVAHSQGFWHRVIHVYFYRKLDKEIELMVHLRSPFKDLKPNCWDPRFGGHVPSGESIEATIKNEIKDETGIILETENLLKGEVRKYDGGANREFIYENYYNFTGEIEDIAFNDGEVQKVEWMGLQDIAETIKLNPENWNASSDELGRIANQLKIITY